MLLLTMFIAKYWHICYLVIATYCIIFTKITTAELILWKKQCIPPKHTERTMLYNDRVSVQLEMRRPQGHI